MSRYLPKIVTAIVTQPYRIKDRQKIIGLLLPKIDRHWFQSCPTPRLTAC